MPLPFAAIASLAAPLIGGILGKGQQDQTNRDNRAQWDLQNQYNHPTQQMSRLREAGLNPNLIYGSSPTSATGNSGAPATAIKAPRVPDMAQPMSLMLQHAQVKNTRATTNNLAAQNDAIIQDTALKAAQVLQTGVRTKQDEVALGVLKKTSLQAAQSSIRNIESRTFGQNIDNNVKNQTQAELIKQAVYSSNILNTKAKTDQFKQAGARLAAEFAKYKFTPQMVNTVVNSLGNFFNVRSLQALFSKKSFKKIGGTKNLYKKK